MPYYTSLPGQVFTSEPSDAPRRQFRSSEEQYFHDRLDTRVIIPDEFLPAQRVESIQRLPLEPSVTIRPVVRDVHPGHHNMIFQAWQATENEVPSVQITVDNDHRGKPVIAQTKVVRTTMHKCSTATMVVLVLVVALLVTGGVILGVHFLSKNGGDVVLTQSAEESSNSEIPCDQWIQNYGSLRLSNGQTFISAIRDIVVSLESDASTPEDSLRNFFNFLYVKKLLVGRNVTDFADKLLQTNLNLNQARTGTADFNIYYINVPSLSLPDPSQQDNATVATVNQTEAYNTTTETYSTTPESNTHITNYTTSSSNFVYQDNSTSSLNVTTTHNNRTNEHHNTYYYTIFNNIISGGNNYHWNSQTNIYYSNFPQHYNNQSQVDSDHQQINKQQYDTEHPQDENLFVPLVPFCY